MKAVGSCQLLKTHGARWDDEHDDISYGFFIVSIVSSAFARSYGGPPKPWRRRSCSSCGRAVGSVLINTVLIAKTREDHDAHEDKTSRAFVIFESFAAIAMEP